MKRLMLSVIFIGLICQHQLLAQNDDPDKYLVVLAEIQKIEQTPMHAITYLFVFKVKELIQGELKDSIISQELKANYPGNYVL